MKKLIIGGLALLIPLALGLNARSVVVEEHVGDTSPTTEGWSRTASGTLNFDDPVPHDAGFGGLPAWKIADLNVGRSTFYHRPLTGAELADADNNGWKLTAKVRVDGAGYNTAGGVAGAAMAAEFAGNATHFGGRWALVFGSDDSGDNALVRVWQKPQTYRASGDGYHQYDLIDSSGSGSATLYVDGVQIASGITISDTYPGARALFGDNHSTYHGNANYNHVALETGSGLTPTIASGDVLYTFEGDRGTNVKDQLGYDGQQNPIIFGSPAVDQDPANAAFGSRSMQFPDSPASENLMNIPGTSGLGNSFTLAAVVDESQQDWSRLFSVYNGGGPANNELILDLDPSQAIGFGLRAFVHGTGVTRSVTGGFADGDYHHVAMTYNNGNVRLFLDGTQLGADASVAGGDVNLFNNLRVGEDYPPTSRTNEPLEGHADDVLVARSALTPPQVQSLAQNGAAAFFTGPKGVLYTFEGDSGTDISDSLTGDGVQNATNVVGGVAVDNTPANAAFGNSSGAFPYLPTGQQNTLDIPNTEDLGSAFTLAAMVDETQNNFSRVFSVYNGGGPANDELIFDIDPSLNAYGFGVRAFVHGTGVVRGVNFADSDYHHLAMTYNNGKVRLYLDGTQLGAEATVSGGAVSLMNNLRFGEDYPPASRTNERLEGHADDILVYRHPLSPSQVQALSANGAAAFFSGPMGMYYSAEGDSGAAGDKLLYDGAQNGAFTTGQVSIDNDPANARFGNSSIAFGTDASARNTVVIDDSTSLGEQYTMAAFVRYDGNTSTLNQARLFTSYDGGGGLAPGELLLDFNPAGGSTTWLNGVRFRVGAESVIPSVPVTFNDGEYHHLAATVDNGLVSTYLDGVLIAKGSITGGFKTLTRNLQLGEDSAGSTGVGEQFIGRMDDVLVLQGVALSKQEVMTLAHLGAEAAAANPGPITAGVFYNAEPVGPGGPSGDKLIQDGAQDAVLHSVGIDPAGAKFGHAGFVFPDDGTGVVNRIELPETRQLGDAFTLAAFVDDQDNDFTRLFSAYDGGPPAHGEFIFDFDPSGTTLPGLRAIANGQIVTAAASFADDEYHHLAMTYDDGLVRLFLDGDEIGNGLAGSGPVNLRFNLSFGEDFYGGPDEQLKGFADEILFLREVLSPGEIAELASYPFVVPEPSSWLLLLAGLGGLLYICRTDRRRKHGD